MRKKILFAPLWGIFALSLLSSCRTEDSAVTQKQIEDKRFAVLVSKDGKTLNYADAFAYLMRKYDKAQKTNLSGLNNTIVLNNLTASINKRPLAVTLEKGDTYVEFNIRTEIATETNGEKSIIYPKVKGDKVIGLVEAVLSQNETRMSYYTYNSDSNLYKDYKDDLQEALERYQKRRTVRLVAGIKPMADSDIEEVVIVVKRKKKEDTPTPRPPEEVGGCQEHAECIDYNPGGGGGNGNGEDISLPEKVDKIDITELKTYPCAFAIAQELPNLKNDLGTVLNKIFKNSDKYDIKFKTFTPTPKNEKDDGFIQSASIKEGDKFNSTIFLNEEVLKNATKEYILVTMYHEVVHAYLNYQLHTMGQEKFSLQYPALVVYKTETYYDAVGKEFRVSSFVYRDGHSEAGYYIDTLEKIVKDYNPNIPTETARIIAKAGIVSLTKTESDINKRERGIDKTLGQQEGIKCTN
ncbi:MULTISPECIES: hypothetical protein [Elizabethkingia]|uniref:hypothetical protein n=1 Tax=Elizabethkingia TaxID=308865 RepID=UPI00074232F7|nr:MULTISPECIES: hypothetical protein [Elizabethkingia]KUG12259.1 hypothetical protein AMC91_07935 [Elizabethkingia miricola]MCL1658757.1 hypothetical protein [Elizabethkingia miricola]MCP1251475.1 hypothetical protein [Elizabethkingia sp. S0634]